MVFRYEQMLSKERKRDHPILESPLDYESISDWWLAYDRIQRTLQIDSITGFVRKKHMVLMEGEVINDLPLWLVHPTWAAMPKLMSKLAYHNVELMKAIAFFQAAVPRQTA